jgi:hypothetical protein
MLQDSCNTHFRKKGRIEREKEGERDGGRKLRLRGGLFLLWAC